jgi:hypothetical protein
MYNNGVDFTKTDVINFNEVILQNSIKMYKIMSMERFKPTVLNTNKN